MKKISIFVFCFPLSNSRISLYFASHIECNNNNYKSSAKINYYQILLHSFLNIAAAIWSISWTLYRLSSLTLVMLQKCHSFQPDKHSKYIRSHFFLLFFFSKTYESFCLLIHDCIRMVMILNNTEKAQKY